MFRIREINEKFDESIERKGFVEDEERIKSFNNNFKSNVKPVLYKGKYIYVSQETLKMLLDDEIPEEAFF